MTYLLESPMPVLFCGLVVEAILATVFFNNRRVVFLLPMIGVALLMLLGVVIERIVVTPREAVEATIDNLADALEANDVQRALGCISPTATHTRSRAEWGLDRFRVSKTRIANLKITINELTSPPTATAAFQGFITIASDRKGDIPPGTYGVAFTAEFEKQGDRWLIAEHTEDTPNIGGP
ncbi:MAG: hypothetical protein NTW96_23655 [Planctomycetia bacterium]|nr:hypothetical protein [Planctomycetia bacterium]